MSVNICLVGYGYWGSRIINGFLKAKNANVVAICEKNATNTQLALQKFPNIKVYEDFELMLADKNIQAVVITTPPETHYLLAKKALLAEKHVLVEKPMTKTVSESEDLIKIASDSNKNLMVDLTFLYMPAVRELKKVVDSGELGDVHTVYGNRSNFGLLQKDVDVLYDLAPHDFSILYYLFNKEPKDIVCIGNAPIKHGLQSRRFNSYSMTILKYESGLFVNFIHSWLSPVKNRQMIFMGDKKTAIFDMLDTRGVLKVYDSSIELNDTLEYNSPWFKYNNNGFRIVDIPEIEGDDLQRVAQEFVDSVLENRKPFTDGEVGKVVVKNLEEVKYI